jgi:hypothetical protein
MFVSEINYQYIIKGIIMKMIILIIVTLLSIVPPAVSQNNSEERTITMDNNSETITIYLTVRRMIINEFVGKQDSLLRNDNENFFKIHNHIDVLLKDCKNNMNPDLIERYVSRVGSKQYINEYKGLFLYLFQKRLRFSGIPNELMYVLDQNDRIVYFEARNLFKDGDKQVFDRQLLQKFMITKSEIKKLYNVNL